MHILCLKSFARLLDQLPAIFLVPAQLSADVSRFFGAAWGAMIASAKNPDAGFTASAIWTAIMSGLETTLVLGVVVPGEAVVLLAGSAVTDPVRFAVLLMAASGGAFLGQLGGYGLGRLAGPWLRASRVGRWVGEARWQRAEDSLRGNGARMLVPLRFVALVHTVAPVVAGIVGTPLRKFSLWAGISAVLWSLLYGTFGYAASVAFGQRAGVAQAVSLGFVVVISLAVPLRARLRRRRAVVA